jgi:hypothetical protein
MSLSLLCPEVFNFGDPHEWTYVLEKFGKKTKKQKR